MNTKYVINIRIISISETYRPRYPAKVSITISNNFDYPMDRKLKGLVCLDARKSWPSFNNSYYIYHEH